MGFAKNDLDGKYFNQADYSVTAVTADPPNCAITVGPTTAGGPPGTGTLNATADWAVN